MKNVLMALLILVFGLGFSACTKKSGMEQTTDKIEDAADDTMDEAKDAAEDVGDSAEDAVDSVD